MPSQTKSLCIFGDSNIGCLNLALKEKLVQLPKGLKVEFWGADGPRFRGLDLVNGELVPREESLASVRLINSNKRDVLNPKDFDLIFFYGVRLRVSEFVEPMFHAMNEPEKFVTDQVLRASCRDWFRVHRFFKVAEEFARSSEARVLLATSSLQIELAQTVQWESYPQAFLAGASDRARIAEAFTEYALKSGIEYFPQPEETITSGCLTKSKFARYSSSGEPDYAHRNSEYGALILKELFKRL